MSATVTLSATSAVSEGGTITYTASVGTVAATSNVTVLLSNGQTITISAGKTSGTLTVPVPNDVYAASPGVISTSIASVTGTGGFGTVLFNTTPVSTTVSDVINVTTVSLSATAAVAEGGAITYTASLGVNPAHSAVTVNLNNGQTITIAAGQTSGSLTVAAPSDVYVSTPGNQTAAIASLTGTGGFESLTFNTSPVTTAVSQVTNVTTVSLSATTTVAEGGVITYTASVGANPAHSAVTVTLNNGKTITIASGQTSGSVTVVAPSDVYAGTPVAPTAAITSIAGTGGFESLTFNPAAVSTVVTDVIDVTTVSLSATAAVAEGGAITYTASLGANPAHSAVTVTLNNGQTITIGAGQTSGAVTVIAPNDVYAATPGTQAAAIAGVTGTGGFESLSFNPAAVNTTVSDVINVTTVSLAATAAVTAGGTITYTASVGANAAHSAVTVALNNGQTVTIAAGQTSGTVAVTAQANQGIQSAAIASITGAGGFESLAFNPAAVSTTVSQVVNGTTVSLAATAAVAEGGTITYTASVGATPASSDVSVALNNGQTITIAAGQTSGAVTVIAPNDVYAATPGTQVAAIASITGTGGFSSLTFNPAPVSTTVSDVVDVTTVSLSATAAVAEGGAITYTASLGANPAHSAVTVALNNGQTITIAAGQTSGTVTVAAAADVYLNTPGTQTAAIASVTGTGGFESLNFNPTPASTSVSDVVDVTTVSLSATAAVAEGGTITYTASVGANPAHSDVTVALNNGQTITIAAGQTSGTVTVAAPADVYLNSPGTQTAAIVSVTGTGGFESLSFNPAAVSTTVSDVVDVTTVSLSATAAVAEGGTITYTASVGANPAHSDVTVALNNGQTITIAAGQTSGTVTVAAPADVYLNTPGTQTAAIASVTGTGGFESLSFSQAAVSTTVSDVVDVTTVSLSATAAVAEGGTITYTASVGANPALSDVPVALNNGQTITIAAGNTSGAVTVLAPADVYAATPGTQLAAIASVSGTGGFESLSFDPAAVNTTVSDVVDVTTVSLSAPATWTPGGSITYTASLGANPAHSAVTVSLDNGQTITIAAGQTSGSTVVTNPSSGPGGAVDAHIALIAGTGGFENLTFDAAAVTTTSNSGPGSSYNLSDTAANLADPLITPAALANGATSITATTAATLAQAIIINGYTNTGTTSYSISDNPFFIVNLANPAVTPVSVGQNATNITVTTPATEAQAQTISLLANSGTLTYDLADQVQVLTAQTPAALRAGNRATNITVTFSPSTGTIVTLAQAAIIDAYTNTGTNSYDLQDTAANLVAATASVLSGGVTIIVTDPASVVQAGTILARATHPGNFLSYALFDTAANLAAAPAAVAGGANQIIANGPATVAQAAAIQAIVPNPAVGTPLHIYDLSDTAEALAGASPLVGNGAQHITATGIATVAQATAIDAYTNTGSNSYVLTDTAANLAAASASVGSGATVITATTAATVAQATVFAGFADLLLPGGGVKNYSLSDTAAALAAASALVGNGAANITATDAATVAQAAAIDAFTNSGVNSYVLSDTAANLAAATAAVGHNATNIIATTAATVAQATAIDAYTNSGTNSFNLADTAANLAAAPASLANQAGNITATTGATVAQGMAIDAFLNSGTNSYGLADTSANLMAAPAATVSAAIQVSVTNPVSAADAVSLRALNGQTAYSLADTAANLAAASGAVGNGAINITATTAATVVQAVTIDAYTNSGSFSYSLADTGDHLSGAPATLLDAATVTTVTDAATVAQALSLLAADPNARFALSDTAANLAAAPLNVGHNATLIDATTAATVAQIHAIYAYSNTTTNLLTLIGLTDSVANLTAAIAALDPALADATSFTVTGTASVAQADAIHGYSAIAAQAHYAVSDTAANLVAAMGVNDAALSAASSFALSGAASVAQANTIHGFNAVSALASYALADTGAALVAAAATTVHAASGVTASTALLAADAATVSGELASSATPFSYSLSDTAPHLAAAAASLVTHASSVTITGAATVAEASTLHAEAPLAAYSIVDVSTNLATALSTANPGLAAVKFAGTIDVNGPASASSLTVNADQFANLLSATHPLLALNDTLAVDGANVAANLGTLHDFGGNDTAGIVLGGPLNGSYIVNLGTSGDTLLTMSGTGHQQITAATGPKETFVVGLTSTGGSTISNLEKGETIDISAGNLGQGTKNSPSTQVATGAQVLLANQWAYETTNHTLTWWDQTHNAAETLTLHFAASGDSGGVSVKSTHSFQVI